MTVAAQSLLAPASSTAHRIAKLREHAEESWRIGDLFWRLHGGQLRMVELVDSAPMGEPVVWHVGRQFGKSYGAFGLCDMLCRAIPGAQVNYIAATKAAVKNIVIPNSKLWLYTAPPGVAISNLEELMALQCPKKYRFKASHDGTLRYWNDSSIVFMGSENDQVDRARGPYKHLTVVDEAGFLKVDLEYLVENVLDGMYTHTGGRTILVSTSPKSVAHQFKGYATLAQKYGGYFPASSLDNPLLTDRERARIIKKITTPGRAGKRAILERFPVWATDPDRAVIPEAMPQDDMVTVHSDGTVDVPSLAASTDYEALPWVKASPLPRYALRYWAIDPGNDEKNLTALLAGYYDFARATLVVTSEQLLLRPTTEDVVAAYHALWDGGIEQIQGDVEGRSDVDLRLVRDLQSAGIPVSPAQKHNKHAAVNKVRDWFKNGRIEVQPHCKDTIAQVLSAVWKDGRQGFAEFDRIKGMGHFDLIDCLVYLVRHIEEQRDPQPYTSKMDQNTLAMLNAHGVLKKSSGSVGETLVDFLRAKR